MPPKPATRSSNQTNPAAARHRSDAAGGDISSSDSSVQEPPKRRPKTHDDSESFDGKQNDSGDDESLQIDASSSDELEEPHPLVDNKSAKGASKSDDVSKSKKTSAAAAAKKSAIAAAKKSAAAKGGRKKPTLKGLIPSPYRPAREPPSPMDSPPQFDSPAKRWNATEKYDFVKGHLQTLQKYASKLHQRHLKDRESSQESLAIAEDAIERRDRYSSTLESEVQTLTIASNANAQENKALKSTIDSQKVSAKLLSGEVDRLKREVAAKEKARQRIEELGVSKEKASISEETHLRKLQNTANHKKKEADKKKKEQQKRIAYLQERASKYGGIDRNMSNLLKVRIIFVLFILFQHI